MRKPVILLDKSALQSLSDSDLERLRSHFFVNLPPVLVAEILADLRKKGKHAYVARLFSKLRAVKPIPCVDWRTLCRDSLLGTPLPKGTVPTPALLTLSADHCVEYGTPLPCLIRIIDEGKNGVVDSEEMGQALRWKEQEVGSIDLEAWRSEAETAFRDCSFTYRFKSSEELGAAVDRFLNNCESDAREGLLRIMLSELEAEGALNSVLDRWRSEGKPTTLKDFAGYAHFCVRTFLIFGLALRDGIITAQRTNRIDLEYFFYSPFCDWFASNDRFHTALYSGILNAKQTFANGMVLKQQLQCDEVIRVAQFNLELPWFFS